LLVLEYLSTANCSNEHTAGLETFASMRLLPSPSNLASSKSALPAAITSFATRRNCRCEAGAIEELKVAIAGWLEHLPEQGIAWPEPDHAADLKAGPPQPAIPSR